MSILAEKPSSQHLRFLTVVSGSGMLLLDRFWKGIAAMILKNHKNEQLAVLAMFLSAAIWGSGFIVTRVAINVGFSTPLILTGRFSIAALIFGVFFRKSIKKMNRRAFFTGLPVGLLLFLGFLFQTLGLGLTTPSRNAFITALYVIIVPFLAWLIWRRRPAWYLFAGAGTSIVGIALLSLDGSGGDSLTGDALTLLCALCFAAHFLALEWAVHRMAIGQLLFMQMAVTTICSLMTLGLNPGGLHIAVQAANETSWLSGLAALLYLALFSSCIAYAIQTTAQKYTTSSKAAIILAAESLWGSLFSLLLGFEPFTIRLLAGGLIIFISILMVELPAWYRPTVMPADDPVTETDALPD